MNVVQVLPDSNTGWVSSRMRKGMLVWAESAEIFEKVPYFDTADAELN